MSIFGALKGKLHKKSLDEEIDEAFGKKEPFSKKVLEANKKLEGEEDPDYNRFAGRSAESFQQSQNTPPVPSQDLQLQQHEQFPVPLTRHTPPALPEPLPVRQQESQIVASQDHQQLASKIQALQRKHNLPVPQHAVETNEPTIPASYLQTAEHPAPVKGSGDLLAEVQELKEQNKKIIEILRDIQKNLRI